VTNEEYTILSFLARALVVNPEDVDRFIAALKTDLAGSPGLEAKGELAEAIEAIEAEWASVKKERGSVGLADVVRIVKRLLERGSPERELAAYALVTAASEQLARKGRESGLSREERAMFAELPKLASTA
jgi:hypothetical protein